jgi:hypothetical protein
MELQIIRTTVHNALPGSKAFQLFACMELPYDKQ